MMLTKIKKRVSDNNSGIAMVSVMIMVTVCLMIATVVLQLTYRSLLSRGVNKKSDDNFYSSESALDDIETVLQNIAINSINSVQSDSSGNTTFINAAQAALVNVTGASDVSSLDNTQISEYIFNQLDSDTKAILGSAVEAGGTTTYVYDSSKFQVKAVNVRDTDNTGTETKQALVFNVYLNYVDENGYRTELTTDLAMNDITDVSSPRNYALGSYSVFSGGGAEFLGNDTGNGTRSVYLQEGNAYIGMMTACAPASMTVSQTNVVFDGSKVFFNGDVYIGDDAAVFFVGEKQSVTGSDGKATTSYPEVVVRGTIYLSTKGLLVIGEDVRLWAYDIVLVDGGMTGGDLSTPSASKFTNSWSVFDTNNVSYVNASQDSYNFMYPFTESQAEDNGTKISVTKSENLKNKKYDYVSDDWNNNSDKKTSGCIMGYKNGKETVLEYKEYTTKDGKTSEGWFYKGTDTMFGGNIGKSESMVPEALASVYCFDGTTQQVDATLATFINLDVLYWQGSPYGQNAVHTYYYGDYYSDTNVKRVTDYSYTVNGTEYHFGDVAMISDMTYSKMKTLSLLKEERKTYSILGISSLLGVSINGFSVYTGSNGGNLINDSDTNNCVTYCMMWGSYGFQSNPGNIFGLNISASKITYKALGKGTVTAYSLQNVYSNDAVSGQRIIDVLKRINTIDLDANEIEKLYSDGIYTLGMADSVIKGGVDTMFDVQSGNGGSSSVKINSSNMYDFISVENWQKN
jgi:hypothetical protein